MFLVLDSYKLLPQTFLHMTFIALEPTSLLSEHQGIELLHHHVHVRSMLSDSFPKLLYQFIHSPTVCEHSLCSTSLPTLILGIQRVYISHSNFFWLLIRLSPFSYVIGHFYILFCKMSTQVSCHFSIGLLAFVYWFVGVLCYCLHVANLFSHFVTCFYSMVSLMFLILM